MSQAEDLLNSLTVENEDEEHIVIDKDRVISVPQPLRRIAVQHDDNVRTVTFDCPRYSDGRDLSQMIISINYMRSDSESGLYLADNIVIDETDDTLLHFDWTIKDHVTEVSGPLSFLVCAKKSNAEGVIENHWNSELNQEMTISKGLECSEQIVEKNPDVITQILMRLQTVENKESFNATGAGANQVPTADGNGNWSWKGIEFPEPVTDDHIRELITGYNYSTFSGSYNDLSDKPEIPEQVTDDHIRELITGYNYSTFSGSYNDLSDKPEIPEVTRETIKNALGYVPPEYDDNKLDKNQGAENSGKIAGINESGDIIPVIPPGVAYNEETGNLRYYGTDENTHLLSGIGLDDTLTKSGYAADAAAVGELKSDLDDLNSISCSWTDGGYISPSDGDVYSLSDYSYTDYINVASVNNLIWVVYCNANAGMAFYDADKAFISGIDGGAITNGTRYKVTIPDNAVYVRFTSIAVYKNKSILYVTDLIGSTQKLQSIIMENTADINKNTEIISVYEKSKRLIDTGNLITSLEPGRIYEVDGSVVGKNSGHYHTNYIKIPESALVLYFCNIYAGEWGAWYNENKEFISGTGIPRVIKSWDVDYLYKLDVPPAAKYVRVSVASSQYANKGYTWCYTEKYAPNNFETYASTASYRDYGELPIENPLEYTGKEFCVFNRCACIGDSITEGVFNSGKDAMITDSTLGIKYSYPTQLQKISGVQCDNYGVGGLTSVEWESYVDEHFTLQGHDVAIINLGINDVIRNVSVTDTETALRSIISKLKSACKNIKIFIATIVPAYADGSASEGQKYELRNAVIKSLADELDDVYLIDLTRYSKTHMHSFYSQGHLTAIGYIQLAQEYMSAIGFIIKTNLSEFKDVQFIGTEYTYSDN